jgi:hypothetical protein
MQSIAKLSPVSLAAWQAAFVPLPWLGRTADGQWIAKLL